MRFLKLCGAAIAALTLSACASTQIGVNHPDPESVIPIALTQCADAPSVPSRPTGPDGKPLPRDDAAKADYVAGLHGAYADCKSTVAAIAVRRHALDVQAGTPAAPKKGLFSGITAVSSNPLKF